MSVVERKQSSAIGGGFNRTFAKYCIGFEINMLPDKACRQVRKMLRIIIFVASQKKRLQLAGVSRREILDFLACCRGQRLCQKCLQCVENSST